MDGSVEHHRQPGVLDVPAHNSKRVWPKLLGGAGDPSDAVLAGPNDRGRGPVAEQCGRHNRRWVVAVEPDRDRTGLDRDEQPATSRFGCRQARCNRKAIDAAGATQAENGNPSHIVAKADPSSNSRLEARRRDSRGRDGDDAVDFARHQTGSLDRGRCRLDKEILARIEVDRVTVAPSVAP